MKRMIAWMRHVVAHLCISEKKLPVVIAQLSLVIVCLSLSVA
jgi:hypothetical protein